MSRWIHNPQGRIIAVVRDLPGHAPALSRRTGAGITLVVVLGLVIALVALWPSNDPAVLPVSAQTEVEDRLVAGVAGDVRGAEYLVALTADGAELWRPELAVYSVGDSGAPRRISSLTAPVQELRDDLPAAPGLAFAGSTAYVPLTGVDRSALWIVDLSNPTAPRELATVELETAPGAVAVNGDLAIVGSLAGTIVRLFDISALAQPQPAGEYRTRVVSFADLAFIDNTFFVSTRDGVTAVDVSPVEAPREIGSWSSENWWRGFPRRLGEITPRLALAGSHLYAAADIWGIEVLDVSDPTDITRPTRSLSVVQIPGDSAGVDDAVHVAATGDTLYALWRGAATDDTPAQWAYTIQEIDISDPGDPQIVSETSDLAGYTSFQSLVIGEARVYFLNGDRIHVVTTAS